ncbi:hypothetical protein ABID95_005400 [Streptomyces atratus]|uniref:hypothetical protein n=1 Tax=Streptomyces atratus TaxID=1893 RepID=UPI0033933A61
MTTIAIIGAAPDRAWPGTGSGRECFAVARISLNPARLFAPIAVSLGAIRQLATAILLRLITCGRGTQ